MTWTRERIDDQLSLINAESGNDLATIRIARFLDGVVSDLLDERQNAARASCVCPDHMRDHR